VIHGTLTAGFAAFFSGGRIRSPVSMIPLGECNTITNRSFGMVVARDDSNLGNLQAGGSFCFSRRAATIPCDNPYP